MDRRDRTTVYTIDQVVTCFPVAQAAGVLERRQPFSLTHRAAQLGPITLLDLAFGADVWIQCADERPYYAVNAPISGHIELVHRKSPTTASRGQAAVSVPEGDLIVPRWVGGGRTISFRVDRHAVENALGDAVGRQITSQIAFEQPMSSAKGPSRSWLHMLTMLNHELFQPDSAFRLPLVAEPFLDSFVRALLLATDHPYREMLAADAARLAPRVIRTAVDIIETEPQAPLTVTDLAARSQVSARALQQGFRRHLGMSPMTYLRQVRLRHAHQELLDSDPSVETVAAIATRWGFTNFGRFAAAHAARYGEAPATTLHRTRRHAGPRDPNPAR
jgi:AraC-like DNA-binding protein